MWVMHHAEEWLDHVDPWGDAEARALLHAVLSGRPVGNFDCVPADGTPGWFVVAAHADVALLLPEAARPALAELLRERFGLDSGHPASAWWAEGSLPLTDWPAAANESRPMPFWEPGSARPQTSRVKA